MIMKTSIMYVDIHVHAVQDYMCKLVLNCTNFYYFYKCMYIYVDMSTCDMHGE